MKEITRINHVGLRVRNLHVTRSFYEQLGFVFLVGPVGPEPVAIMVHPSGVNINFILNADVNSAENVLMDIAKKYTGYTHIALEVSDAKIVANKIEQLGIVITEQVEYEGAQFFLLGILIMLLSFINQLAFKKHSVTTVKQGII